MYRESFRVIKQKRGEGTKYLIPANDSFQARKVQTCITILKFFDLSFFHNHSRSLYIEREQYFMSLCHYSLKLGDSFRSQFGAKMRFHLTIASY